ncbi:carboxypeptidase M32 [Myxococcus llanfairpwllgwyngyllgogerychwyrndrobwllllantysiliogogogochensis]|uniref:Metal-dependent carboxypeptidase n=1 Tax=Myxococcus llanfairpwllgwyngyllgogerychwyrndrobwllllantysiliogogogochensis TaxID=2590453 RepID=A0A540WTG9_9BACT|nr:carboxypeptidase M32 [Myxococcus llanfairpwllgwyngyllgogerychwyrndrobwllllantysiliogogogochensis]TQF12309.1 carboxypeptidase M32 [Myxococcus llanfairpwllgwyngyllgogerychwyrndrobwllllantysiliogogogochensis]
MDTWLLSRMQELKDLQGLIGLATWDQETYLPAKAGPARAHQLSTLQGIHHERLVDPRLGDALARAATEAGLSDDERAMVTVLQREREREVRVPAALVRALAEAQSHGLHAWREARKERRFARFQPALQRLLELRREQADAYGHDGERYDGLLEGYEPGMRVSRLTPVLTTLREQLIPMVGKLTGAKRQVPALFDGRRYDKDAQWRFTLRLLGDLGFDLEAGRQDLSIHPFTGGTHALDVRLTTHVDESNPLSAIFSTIHEAGHGLFEQGFSPEHYRTPLAASPSMGLHESQSRLWENLVGRGRPFWEHYFPLLRESFPDALAQVDLEAFHTVVNDVRPSLIRTESDEVTYNLHIAVRYELELLLIRDELPLEELPAAWNARMERYLGVTPPDDTQGVLQDIHWAWGELGYFPTYSLGNLYSASLYRAAGRELPDLEGQLRRGQMLPLRDWLRERIHRQGFRLPAEERVREVTGQGLTDADFLGYLRAKYGALYGISL